MARDRTWNILEWGNRPERTAIYCVACPECGTDALLEVGETPVAVIGAVGLGLIFDDPSYVPPDHFLPTMIRCRSCRMAFATDSPATNTAMEG